MNNEEISKVTEEMFLLNRTENHLLYSVCVSGYQNTPLVIQWKQSKPSLDSSRVSSSCQINGSSEK